MRVLSCKLQCPSICFSKSTHIIEYSSASKSENVQETSADGISRSNSNTHVLEINISEDKTVKYNKENELDAAEVVDVPKSSLKKSQEFGAGTKGRVKWMDYVGKELVEIKEFEPIELDESDDEFCSNQSCICTIQ